MAIVNESEQKVVLNYIKTQKLLASPIDGLKIYLRFFPNSQTNGGGEGVQMLPIIIANHTSVL